MSDGVIVIDTLINQDGAESGLSQLQGRMESAAGKMTSVGESMSKNLTLPLLAVGGAALKVAADFDSVSSKIQAQLGVTATEADKLADSAKNVWANGFGESMEETGDAIAKVRQNIGELNGAELEDVTQKAFTLSEAFDADINESTRAAGQLMKEFKVNSSEAFDLITWGFQNGLDYTGEWLDTVREYSPQFSEMGFTAEQMGSMMKAGFDAGAWSLDKIGDSIKESHLRMGALDKSTVDAYESMGLNADEYVSKISKGGEEGSKAFQEIVSKLMDVDDATERNALSTALFGTQYEDLREKVIFSMAGAEDSIEGLEGTADNATKALEQSFSKRLSSVWRETQASLLPLGQVLLDLAETALPYVEKAVSSLSKWFSGLSDNGKMMTVAIGGILGAAGPLLVVLGSFVGAISNLMPIIKTAWSWFSKLSKIFKYVRIALLAITSPIGLIIVAVAGLAYLIYKYWDEIKEYTKSAWEATTKFLSESWDWIKEKAISIFNGIVEFLKEWGLVLLGALTGPFGLLAALIYKYWDEIKIFTSKVWQSVMDFIVGKLNSISTSISIIMDVIKVYIDNAWLWIEQKFMSALQSIAETLGINFETIRYNVQVVMDTIKQTIDTVWYYIKTTFQNALDFLKALVNGDFEGMKTAINNQMELIKETISYIWSDIKEVFRNLIEAIKTVVQDKFDALKQSIRDKMISAKETIRSIWNEVVAFFEGIDLFEIGQNIIQGLIDGIGDMARSLNEKVTGVVSGIKDKITGALDINSPSRWMRDMIGRNMMLGWEIGIDNEKSSVLGKAAEMVSWMIPELPNLTSVLPSFETVPNTTSSTSSTNTVNNNTPITVELNYSGSASQQDLKGMVKILSEELDKLTKQNARKGGVIFANKTR